MNKQIQTARTKPFTSPWEYGHNWCNLQKTNRATPTGLILTEKELADSTLPGFCDACGSGDPLGLPKSARKEERGGLGIWNVIRTTPPGNIHTDHWCYQIHSSNLLEGSAFHPSVSWQRYRTKCTITTKFARDPRKPLVQHLLKAVLTKQVV